MALKAGKVDRQVFFFHCLPRPAFGEAQQASSYGIVS
jgi:hypothetical protein